jgi:hypothetical protein
LSNTSAIRLIEVFQPVPAANRSIYHLKALNGKIKGNKIVLKRKKMYISFFITKSAKYA